MKDHEKVSCPQCRLLAGGMRVASKERGDIRMKLANAHVMIERMTIMMDAQEKYKLVDIKTDLQAVLRATE